MGNWVGVTIVATAVAVMTLACNQQLSATAVIEDKVYSVTPDSVKVKAGILTGEVIELKVAERVEKGSGRVVSPAKLTGTLRLKNTSTNQTVRLGEGKILYIDAQGQPIKLEEARTDHRRRPDVGARAARPGQADGEGAVAEARRQRQRARHRVAA